MNGDASAWPYGPEFASFEELRSRHAEKLAPLGQGVRARLHLKRRRLVILDQEDARQLGAALEGARDLCALLRQIGTITALMRAETAAEDAAKNDAPLPGPSDSTLEGLARTLLLQSADLALKGLPALERALGLEQPPTAPANRAMPPGSPATLNAGHPPQEEQHE